MTERITSHSNPRIKSLVRLRKRRERDATGLFLIEGYREISRALDAGVEIRTMYTAPDLFLGANEPALAARAESGGAEIFEVDEGPFAKASYRDRPEGLIAVAEQFDTSLSRISSEGPALLLVAAAIEKPGNLGTMIRTALAAGGTGVVVADPTTDPFNPNVIRASLGAVFALPPAIATADETIAHLRSAGMTIVATTPDATQAHFDCDLTDPAAIVVGSEQYGLSDEWLKSADLRVSIPMPGPVDSLNAAMAAGIVLFEAVRQRAAL